MTHDATHDDLARLLRWRPRPPADADEVPQPPDPTQIGALLDEIDALRLSLSVDMDVLASAVELRAYDVAAEVVDGERADLAAFSTLAEARLTAGAAGADAPPAPARRGLGRVLRAALPAAPALAAAAALVGVLAGLAPGPRTTTPDAFGASNAGFAELFGLQERAAASPDQAQALREELVRVMALAMHDPQAAAQALPSLRARVEQVEDDGERTALRDAVAEVARLLAALDVPLDEPLAAVDVVTDPVAEAVSGLGDSPRPVPLPSPSAVTAPRAADGGADGDADDDAAKPTPAPTTAKPTPTPSPTGSEASVGDVLPGGAANGSTGLLPGPGGLGG